MHILEYKHILRTTGHNGKKRLKSQHDKCDIFNNKKLWRETRQPLSIFLAKVIHRVASVLLRKFLWRKKFTKSLPYF